LSTSRSLAACILALAWAGLVGAFPERESDSKFGRPQIEAVNGKVKVIPEGRVKDFGKVIYEGPIDVNVTLERVREGRKLEHRNDGVHFQNRERRLPVKSDRDYYREFVHWDPKLNAKFKTKAKFPGPQRVVIGKKGEVFYSGDHYNTWKRVN
jgi:guanyl-specific ribonuclease Sa